VTRNLTLNIGLRFEYEDGIREKDDQMFLGFDPDALTSISQAAEAAYLRAALRTHRACCRALTCEAAGCMRPTADRTYHGDAELHALHHIRAEAELLTGFAY
jgi:hypothetical protein